jgi:hypothetical protein
MAKIFPDISTIKTLRVKPTDGELHLITFLSVNLDDSFEVYFNPYLDGDRPDVIIVKESFGVVIIEVKDWNLKNYFIDENNKWYVTNGRDSGNIKSPQSQVFKYKTNLYDLHIRELGLNEAINKHYFSLTKVLVYFHNSSKNIIDNIYSNPLNKILSKINDLNFEFKEKGMIYEHYEKKLNYLTRIKKKIERDKAISFYKDNLTILLNKLNKMDENSLFNDLIYEEISRRLSPPEFTHSQSKTITFTSAQNKISESSAELRKVKGVAGSGKTEILSRRAVNARKRHSSEVLILTFNLTLRPLIKDRLSNIQGTTKPKGIEVTNYHQFFRSMCNLVGFDENEYVEKQKTSIISDDYFDILYNNESIFEGKETIRYNTILIDEIQDYNKEWIKILSRFFLKDAGEMILFGDQSQNIYHKETSTSDSLIIRGFGRWIKLTKSFRSKIDTNLVYLFKLFQEYYIRNLYQDAEIFESKYVQGMINYDVLEYNKTHLDLACELIRKYIRINNLVPNDVTIICSSIKDLRQINDGLIVFEKTMPMITTSAEIKILSGSADKERQLKKLMRRKKVFFMQNSGLIKLSTVHSFKGMESPTIFFILKDVDDAELVYTAITRAKTNLIILDVGNGKYSNFFESQLDKRSF